MNQPESITNWGGLDITRYPVEPSPGTQMKGNVSRHGSSSTTTTTTATTTTTTTTTLLAPLLACILNSLLTYFFTSLVPYFFLSFLPSLLPSFLAYLLLPYYHYFCCMLSVFPFGRSGYLEAGQLLFFRTSKSQKFETFWSVEFCYESMCFFCWQGKKKQIIIGGCFLFFDVVKIEKSEIHKCLNFEMFELSATLLPLLLLHFVSVPFWQVGISRSKVIFCFSEVCYFFMCWICIFVNVCFSCYMFGCFCFFVNVCFFVIFWCFWIVMFFLVLFMCRTFWILIS